MKRIISVVSFFFLLQLFFTIPAVLLSSFGNVMKGMTGRPNVPSTDIDPTIYACALIAFNICMIGILMKTRWVNSTIHTWKEIEAKHLLACIPAVLFGIFVVNGISELTELQDNNMELYKSMATSIPGIITIVILAPICEELTFRDAIQGYLHRNGYKAWHCIIASAMLFGIIHLNPAQIPFAFAMGLFLGWLYYRTGSVMPGIVCHILNNGIAIVSIATSDSDETLIETLGTTNFVIAMIVSTVAFAVLTFWLNRHFDNHPKITIEENIAPNEE